MASTQFQVQGNFNSFIPEATGQLISFQRDPKEFKVNSYCQYVQTKKPLGVYKRQALDQPVRSLGAEVNIWQNGKKRPDGHENHLKFDDVMFQCIRRTETTTIGWETIEQADVKILTAESEMCQSQLMTKRTNRVITKLETATNWPANNQAAAAVLNRGAGFWDQGQSDPLSSNFCAIKKTLNAVAVRINLLTNGKINPNKDGVMRLLISPEAAWRISETPEIHAYLKESPDALAQIKGDKPGQNALYGLPDRLYGWELVIEDCPIVTSNDVAAEVYGGEASIATGDRRYIKSTNNAVVLSRVGGLDGQYGAQSFSTMQMYYVGQEIDIETQDDTWNRLTKVGVTEETAEELASPISGFLVTDLFSPASVGV